MEAKLPKPITTTHVIHRSIFNIQSTQMKGKDRFGIVESLKGDLLQEGEVMKTVKDLYEKRRAEVDKLEFLFNKSVNENQEISWKEERDACLREMAAQNSTGEQNSALVVDIAQFFEDLLMGVYQKLNLNARLSYTDEVYAKIGEFLSPNKFSFAIREDVPRVLVDGDVVDKSYIPEYFHTFSHLIKERFAQELHRAADKFIGQVSMVYAVQRKEDRHFTKCKKQKK